MIFNPTLPNGWTSEDLGASQLLLRCADGGMVTLDFERRLFRAGYSTAGPPTSTAKYTGRGWQQRLLADAIAQLGAVWSTPSASGAGRSEAP